MIMKYRKCDRCGAMTPDDDPRFGTFIGALWQSSEEFDLCPACSEAVQRFIALGKEPGDALLETAGKKVENDACRL